MIWPVEYTDEFGAWWDDLGAAEQESVAASVGLLERLGPELPFPHASGIAGSRHGHSVSFACSIAGARCGYSTPSIPGARRCCSSVATNPAVTVGTIDSFLWPIVSMTSISPR